MCAHGRARPTTTPPLILQDLKQALFCEELEADDYFLQVMCTLHAAAFISLTKSRKWNKNDFLSLYLLGHDLFACNLLLWQTKRGLIALYDSTFLLHYDFYQQKNSVFNWKSLCGKTLGGLFQPRAKVHEFERRQIKEKKSEWNVREKGERDESLRLVCACSRSTISEVAPLREK